MTIPIKFQDRSINLTSENMAKIIPQIATLSLKFHYMEFLRIIIIKRETRTSLKCFKNSKDSNIRW